MPWWIPLVMPTATFIHSKLPPLPGFAPVVEIEDEGYILVEHDVYAGIVDKVEEKPEPKSTDEVLEEERRKEERKKEERRRDSGTDVEPKSKRQPSKEEAALATLMDRIDKEIVENQEDPFNWQWFGGADSRNRDIYIYNKRRLLIETKLKTTAETKHFMPIGRDTTKIDMELRALDMARQQLDRCFIAKYDYVPPIETWASVEQENTGDFGRRAIIKGVIRAAYGVNVPFL